MNGYIDLTGNSHVGGLVPGIANSFTERKAVLFMFSPRVIGDHYKRPMMYQFNTELMNTLSENINKSILVGSPFNPKQMFHSSAARRSVLPATKGIELGFSKYDDYWTGVLIVFNDVNQSVVDQNALNNRVVYMGMFDDEPVNRMTLYQESPTLNPLVNFYITRKIVFNKIRAYTANGLVEKDDLTSDIGIFHYDPSILKENDRRLFNLEPENLLKNTKFNDNNELIISDLEGISTHAVGGGGNEKMETIMQSPKKHLDSVFSNIVSGVEYAKHQREEQEFDNGLFDMTESIRENSELYMGCNTIEFADQVGLVSNSSYQLNDIIKRYNPKIQPIIVPKTSKADIIPQRVTSANNVFSSLVTSCIPSYMSRTGISSLAFTYNSFHGALQVHHVEGYDSSNKELLVKKWATFFRIFKFELEPVIKATVGEFDISVNSSVNGSTYVHLNLMDFELLPDNAVYEESTILGGLTSANIGNHESMFTNASQLGGMVKVVSENFMSFENSTFGNFEAPEFRF